MKLTDLMDKVQEQNLSKDQLEHYHSELTILRAKLKEEFATLKKEKARFLIGREQGESMASREASWGASPSGQRKYDIEGYIGSVNSLIDNVKARLYNTY